MPYEFQLGVLAEDGRVLEHAPVTPDWSPLVEWAHFDAVRRGELPTVHRAVPGSVEPEWDAGRGAPFVGALRVRTHAGGASAVRTVPRTALAALADARATALVAAGVLEAHRPYHWFLTANAERAAVEDATDDGFAVEPMSVGLAVAPGRWSAVCASARFLGPPDQSNAHVPVVVHRRVLDEIHAATDRAGDVEIGGVLVGRLRRDPNAHGPGRPELFVEVSAQVPAEHAIGSETRLTFTSDTWAAAREAIARRAAGEGLTGWWHRHIDLCRMRGCSAERRAACAASDPFLSAEDLHLHATCFPAAHHVALLVSESAARAGRSTSLFGWFQGRVVARGFHLLDPAAGAQAGGPDDSNVQRH